MRTLKKHRLRSFLFGFLLLLFSGCSSGGESSSSPDSVENSTPQFSTVRLSQVLLREVPSQVNQQRFTGFDQAGEVRYGPVTRAKSTEIVLENVSTDVTRLQIEYLVGSEVVGLGSTSLSLTVGQIFELANPPFQDVTAALVSIQVSPGGATIADGTELQYTAIGTFADSTQVDLSSSVSWNSSNGSTATIVTGGLASAVSPGNTTIQAALGAVSDSTTLTVSAAEIVSITVTPATPAIANGTTQQFTAMATLSDGSTQDVTNTVQWSSGAVGVATIDPSSGLATAVDSGQTVMTATLGSASGTATLTVTQATVSSILVTPANPTLADGTSQQFTATATLSDGSVQDITSAVSWTSDTTSVATISASGGLATAASTSGSTNIQAQFDGVTGSTTLTVSAAEIVSITVTPATPAIADGTTQQFTATANLSGGTMQDVTSSAAWTSGSTATATVDPSTGLATGVDPGQSTITASVGSLAGSANLTVTSATLLSLAIEPSMALSAPGSSRGYRALGTYSDGTIQDLTSEATWSSDSSDVLMVNNHLGPNSIGDAKVDESAGATGSGGTPVTVSATFGSNTANSALYIGLFVYTSNSGDGNISVFSGDSSAGTLSQVGSPVSAGSSPNKLQIHPWGLLLYHTDPTDNTVATYSINPETGALTAIGTPVGAGFTPNTIAVDPSGRYAFVADNTVFEPLQVFEVDSATGELIAGIDVAEVETAIDVVVHPSGEFVYVGNQFTTDGLSRFGLDQETGLLTFQGYHSFTFNSEAMDITPSGEYLYVSGHTTIQAYAIDSASGALTTLNQIVETQEIDDIKVGPYGNLLFAIEPNANLLRTYHISPSTGELFSANSLSTGSAPVEIAIEPNGVFVYLLDQVDDDISVFRVNSATGALTLVGAPISVGDRPVSIVTTP